ncbi:MAG: ribonuclease III [Thermomicrobiales bacterium]
MHVAPPEPAPRPAAPPALLEAAERLSLVIGISFDDPTTLALALTHRSILNEWAAAGLNVGAYQSNERLEFLGDAILGALVAEYLYERYPDAAEGVLTAARIALVRAETLVRWAREIDLADYITLAKGEKITPSDRDRILAGAFEAVVGAIFIDRGITAVHEFVHHLLLRTAEAGHLDQDQAEVNPKGELQEWLQGRGRTPPSYDTVTIEGPDHARRYTVAVTVEGERWGVGSGVSKRDAQQAAARDALATLRRAPGQASTAPLPAPAGGGAGQAPGHAPPRRSRHPGPRPVALSPDPAPADRAMDPPSSPDTGRDPLERRR